MEFALSEEHQMLKDLVRRFVDDQLIPLERSVLKKGRHLAGEAVSGGTNGADAAAPAPGEMETARPTGNSSLLLASKLQDALRRDS